MKGMSKIFEIFGNTKMRMVLRKRYRSLVPIKMLTWKISLESFSDARINVSKVVSSNPRIIRNEISTLTVFKMANLVSDDAVGVGERVGLNTEAGVGDDVEGVRREHLLGVEARVALRQVAQVRHEVVANLFSIEHKTSFYQCFKFLSLGVVAHH